MVPDNILCHSPPSCCSEFMTLIIVSMCVRKTEGASKTDTGRVIELGLIEFSGMHNTNHLTFKRPPE